MLRWICVSTVCALLGLGTLEAVRRAAGAETSPAKAAAVAEAAKVLDLTTFPVPKGVTTARNRSIAGMFYEVPGAVKENFQFQRDQLLKQGWKELPGAPVSEQSGSGTFTRDGFTVSVMVFPTGKAGTVAVTLSNHGNVAVGKLPVPAGAKPFYDTPVSAAFLTEAPVEKSVEECRKLLLAQGWQPYGSAGNSWYFKQNAVRLSAQIAAAPAQSGKTVITYSTEQLSADLPAPEDSQNLQYADVTKQLSFDTSRSQDDTASFYRAALSKAGWQPTTEKPIQIDWKHVLIFRNPPGDMLTLEMYTVEGKLRVQLKHQSAAEVAAAERELKAAAERKKQELAKPLPKVAVPLPADAENIKQTKSRIEFTVNAGKAKAIVEGWQKQFGAAGWKENQATLTATVGALSLSKDGQQLSITYVDTGIMPAEITFSATGAELEKVTAGKQNP